MTPQSSFMILAPIDPARKEELETLLESMNDATGQVNPKNSLIPFGEFDTLHFARLLILDDQTTGDVSVYGLTPRAYPVYFTLLGDVDGDESVFLAELAKRAPEGLRSLFSCCEGFSADEDLVGWMRRHRSPPVANYINTRGRTVIQIREEAGLREAIENYLAGDESSLEEKPAKEVHREVRKFVHTETAAGRLRLTPEARTPMKWRILNTLHLLGIPLLLLFLLPLLVLIAPIFIIILRHREKTDPEVVPTVSQEYSDALSLYEDHDITNPFSAMGSLKPGLFRLLTLTGVLLTVDYAARHLTWAGQLGRIRTIHFARWVFVAGTERMVFFSNYDGSVDSYMDDFINKTGFGLNASFSNGIGYPTTNWLIKDGCIAERKYKEYLRRHSLPSLVWYKAYLGYTAADLERNTRIRRGVEMAALSEPEAREWVSLL